VTQNIIVPPATAPTVPVTPPISLPLTIGGLSINSSGAAGAAGDLHAAPLRHGGQLDDRGPVSPASLAVANPVVATPAAANKGSLAVMTSLRRWPRC
jgi:hypothetical protein